MRFLLPIHLRDPDSACDSRNKMPFKLNASDKIVSGKDFLAFLDARAAYEHTVMNEKTAQKKIKDLFAQEKERGYREGIQSAKMEQAEYMIEQVSRSVDYFESVEKRVVDLVLASVKKIIYDFSDRDLTISVVKNALSAVRSQKQVMIKVSPIKYEEVHQSLDQLLKEFPGVSFIDVTADNRLSKHSCILESEIGIVEVNVEEQLEAIQNTFRKVLGKHTPTGRETGREVAPGINGDEFSI